MAQNVCVHITNESNPCIKHVCTLPREMTIIHLVGSTYIRDDASVCVTVYTGFTMVALQGRLFRLHPEYCSLQREWDEYVDLMENTGTQHTSTSNKKCQLFITDDTVSGGSSIAGVFSLFHVPMFENTRGKTRTSRTGGVSIVSCLRIIQRAVQIFLYAQRQRARRRTTVLMALHPRLGRNSLLATLPSDILYVLI